MMMTKMCFSSPSPSCSEGVKLSQLAVSSQHPGRESTFSFHNKRLIEMTLRTAAITLARGARSRLELMEESLTSDATLAESDSSSSQDSVLLEGLHLRPTTVCKRRNTG